MQAKGVSINDDAGLEREAYVMGTKALQMMQGEQVTTGLDKKAALSSLNSGASVEPTTIQRKGGSSSVIIYTKKSTVKVDGRPISGFVKAPDGTSHYVMVKYTFEKVTYSVVKKTTDSGGTSVGNIDHFVIRIFASWARVECPSTRTNSPSLTPSRTSA